MLRSSIAIMCLCVVSSFASSACGQVAGLMAYARGELPVDWYNVRDFGAVGDGCHDDQPHIQAAINWARDHGGGTVYLPAGQYRLLLPHDVIPTTHLLIEAPGIALVGDAASLMRNGPDCGYGTRLVPASDDKAAITVGYTLIDRKPDGILIANLGIDRDPGCRAIPCNFVSPDFTITPQPGATGIRFESFVTGPEPTDGQVWFRLPQLTNLWIRHQYDGILGVYTNSNRFANVSNIVMQSVRCENNARHGVKISIGGGRIGACSFIQNGTKTEPSGEEPGGQTTYDGCGFWYERPVGGPGTMLFNDCTFSSNKQAGLWMVGTEVTPPPSFPVRDVHITGCQFDANLLRGMYASHFQNLNISGCSFSANGEVVSSSMSAVQLESGVSLSMSGCTIRGSSVHGMTLSDCESVAVTGVNFDFNSKNAPLVGYSLRLIGGRDISLSALTIRPTFNSTTGVHEGANGIQILNNPRAFFGEGITFGEDFAAPPTSGSASLLFNASGSGGSASGQIRFWNPLITGADKHDARTWP